MRTSSLSMMPAAPALSGGHAARLSILVLTYNRYPFLRRLLTYYRDASSAPYAVYVLDSSSQPLVDPVLCDLLRAPQIHHMTYGADTMPTAKIFDGLRHVRTPYVVLWADDDLMVPGWFSKGLDYLDQHPDVSLTFGESGLFELSDQDGGGGGRTVSSISPYWQRSYTAERPRERLVQFLEAYAMLFYSIHRTRDLQENVGRFRAHQLGFPRAFDPIQRSDMWVELGLSSLSVIQGKAVQLPGLYMMRERHPGIDSWEVLDGRLSVVDWITCASFSRGYQIWSELLSEALLQYDHVTKEQAQNTVRIAWCSYLARTLARKLPERTVPSRAARRWSFVCREIRDMALIRVAWRQLRALTPQGRRLFALDPLLRRSSPYHQDFLPIYRVITQRWDMPDRQTDVHRSPSMAVLAP